MNPGRRIKSSSESKRERERETMVWRLKERRWEACLATPDFVLWRILEYGASQSRSAIRKECLSSDLLSRRHLCSRHQSSLLSLAFTSCPSLYVIQ